VPSQPPRHLGITVALVACGVLPALGGCAEKQVRAAAPVAPVPAEAVRPMTTAPDTDATPPAGNASPPAPTLPPAATPAPPPVSIPAEKPPAPRKPSPEQSTAEAEATTSHPPVPQISPQLSPSDQAAYQRKTGEDISVAESNLHQTQGRQLNAAQADLSDKIRSFLAQSRDASKRGDWASAQNLALKARVLSIELINSL
jgi:hypothetical protein